MAIREIRLEGDPILYKKCREITEVTDRTRELAQDMIETMHQADGVGLAGPQVGILRRIVVIDVGEGPIVFINPKIVATEGEQFGSEGCLSVPGKYGMVRRPEYVKTESFDLDMKPFTIEGHGLLARAMCHEFDHLDGHLYTEKVEGRLHDYDEADYEE